ncbi:Protein of unknown function [Micromonospora phaseoli]|uniref:DUF998 domain-containing protein n=1 Tax=Micromonospora phaseoli TaxID=1144548 RepID=A0A1H6RFX3_9ACTN|nr:DUF998 domain-containing protein [Micromonospora phaseoli]PZW03485.1 uncharacterized protein DUF998 [Micromonospora phaseoli]GIJ77052.1 hypothetical protein Xph01_14840 [Micromonospora phaseoli]SEI54718.1 Protein of unknown function [Micromonospora phaseoli]
MRRAAALVATLCVLAGTVAVTLAVIAGPGPGLTGYVSEAGVADSGYAWTYRMGVFALAGALLLLAVALRVGAAHRADRALRVAGTLLVAAGLCTVLSGAVTCSAGCPLPPFERATVADLVHGAASIAATAAVVFAMLAVAFSSVARRPLRRTGVVAAAVSLPLAGAVGLAMLLVGRSPLVGVLERLLLAVAVGWALVTAGALALRNPSASAARDPSEPGAPDRTAPAVRDPTARRPPSGPAPGGG